MPKTFVQLQQSVYQRLEESPDVTLQHHWPLPLVKEALNFARLKIMNDVVDDALYDFTLASSTSFASNTSAYDLPTAMLRMTNIKVGSYSFGIVSEKTYHQIDENLLLTMTAARGVCSIFNGKINFLPAIATAPTCGSYSCSFIRFPADMSGDSDAHNLPGELENALIVGACIILLESDSDAARYQGFMSEYLSTIQPVSRKEVAKLASNESTEIARREGV